MFMFSFSDASSTASAPDASGGMDDSSKPNSLYGGSSTASTASSAVAAMEGTKLLAPDYGYLDNLPPSEDYEECVPEKNLYGDVLLAECCVERAFSSRREKYYFTMGKKVGWYF